MSRLNKSEQNLVERLESMTIEDARKALAEKQFGDIGSPNHHFCSSWLSVKESERRDERDFVTLNWARYATYAAYAAAIIAAVSTVITIIYNF